MNNHIDSRLVDRIVESVMSRLEAGADPATENDVIVLEEPVITAELLAERLGDATRVRVSAGSLVTPLARDFLRDRGVSCE